MKTFKIDPLKKYEEYSDSYIMEWCGILPHWIAEAEEEKGAMSAALDANYPFGLPAYNFEGTVLENGTYQSKDDPDLFPLMRLENEAEIAFIYEYAIVAIVDKETKEPTLIKRFD